MEQRHGHTNNKVMSMGGSAIGLKMVDLVKKKFADNWNNRGAKALTDINHANGKAFYTIMGLMGVDHNFRCKQPSMYPTIEGGLVIEYRLDDTYYITIIIENDYMLYSQSRNEDPDATGMYFIEGTLDDMENFVAKLCQVLINGVENEPR